MSDDAPIWPFKPLTGMVEACEWLTDVIQAREAETRELVREYPVREFQLSHQLDHQGQAYARYLSLQGVDFRLPDWSRFIRLDAPATGQTVDIPDGAAVLWRAWDDVEEVEVTGGQLVAVASSSPALGMPLLVCRASDPYKSQRQAGRWAQVSINLKTTDGEDYSSTSRYALYGSYSLVTDCSRVGSSSADESNTWDTTELDNGVGIPAQVENRAYSDEVFSASWVVNADDWPSLRAWLYSRAGRYLPFWLPSFAKDLGKVYLSGGYLFAERWDTTETRIFVYVGGVLYPRQVTAHLPVGAVVRLTLDTALPAGTLWYAGYLRLCRLNTDRVEVTHNAGASYQIKLACVRVPE